MEGANLSLAQQRATLVLPTTKTTELHIGCDAIYYDGQRVHLRGPLDFTFIADASDADVRITLAADRADRGTEATPVCAYESPDEPGRICRRRNGHAGPHRESPYPLDTEPISEEGLIAAVERLAFNGQAVEGAERGALGEILASIRRFRGCHDGSHYFMNGDERTCICGESGQAASE